MKIYSWNVNGIRAAQRRGDLAAFMDRHGPDILCLQETRALPEEVSLDLPGYHVAWHPAARRGYSGTAIVSRVAPRAVTNGLPAVLAERRPLTDKQGRDANREGRVITADFGAFYLVNVYTPNVGNDLGRLPLRHEAWDPAFRAWCLELEQDRPVIIAGDLNVAHTEQDLANPGPNRGRKGFTDEEREGIDRLIEEGFLDSFRLFTRGNGHYTFWSRFANARARNIGWRIDYVLISARLRGALRAAEIHADVGGSDHCPISITLDPGVLDPVG